MELNTFIKELEASLIRRGVKPDVADKHVHTLQRTFTDDDLNEIDHIQSSDEVEDIADSIALILTKNKLRTRAPQPSSENSAQERQSYPAEAERHAKAQPPEKSSAHEKNVDDFFEIQDKKSKAGKGFYIFWLAFIFTLPLTAALAAIFFGAFAAAFAALAALIVGLIAGLIALVAVGAGVSLVGIIFGITQLFTFVASGVYEIGLGVMIIGVVTFVGVLLYNVAVHFLPWVIRKTGVLLKFSCGKIRELFLYVRRECYRL